MRIKGLDFDTHHWDLEEGDELKKMADRSQVLVPRRDIVTKPVTNVTASANKRAAGNDHGAFIRTSLQHAVTASLAHHCAIQVVRIILCPAPRVDQISLSGFVAYVACFVLDSVSGKEEVSIWKAFLVTKRLSGCDAADLGWGSRVLVAWKVAETGRLVHVDPKRVNVDSSVFVEEVGELIVPVTLSVRYKPIWKYGSAWPYFAFPRVARAVFEKRVCIDAPVVSGVVLGRNS